MAVTAEGVEAALNDADCYGGTTEGWSTWILEVTLLPVNTNLAALAGNRREPLSRRTMAQWVLWRRTGQPQWLAALPDDVSDGGDPAAGFGRWCLASVAARLAEDLPAGRQREEAGRFSQVLRTPWEKPLPETGYPVGPALVELVSAADADPM